MIIDSHQHVWNLDKLDYPWLGPALSPIDRTIGADELGAVLGSCGIGATVLVQSADADADTDNMLDVADACPEVVAVVAWVPLDQPERAASRLAELRRDPRVVGVRALIHDMSDPRWILRPEVDEGLMLLADAGATLDIVTADPAALALVPELSARHPDLRMVIDHLGKPPVGGSSASFAEWRQLLAAAAENPLVYAKVSGLYSSVGEQESWTPEGLRPIVETALEVFGPPRLMYGGDWPMSVLAGGYARVWSALSGLFDELAPTQRERLLGGTATDFYRIDADLLARAAGWYGSRVSSA